MDERATPPNQATPTTALHVQLVLLQGQLQILIARLLPHKPLPPRLPVKPLKALLCLWKVLLGVEDIEGAQRVNQTTPIVSQLCRDTCNIYKHNNRTSITSHTLATIAELLEKVYVICSTPLPQRDKQVPSLPTMNKFFIPPNITNFNERKGCGLPQGQSVVGGDTA